MAENQLKKKWKKLRKKFFGRVVGEFGIRMVHAKKFSSIFRAWGEWQQNLLPNCFNQKCVVKQEIIDDVANDLIWLEFVIMSNLNELNKCIFYNLVYLLVKTRDPKKLFETISDFLYQIFVLFFYGSICLDTWETTMNKSAGTGH